MRKEQSCMAWSIESKAGQQSPTPGGSQFAGGGGVPTWQISRRAESWSSETKVVLTGM
jgi:hypothetical protein